MKLASPSLSSFQRTYDNREPEAFDEVAVERINLESIQLFKDEGLLDEQEQSDIIQIALSGGPDDYIGSRVEKIVVAALRRFQESRNV